MADSTFTIFYSWQSDLPNSTTRGLIESSIEAAVRSLRDTVSVYADRDTQGVTGSPDIVQTIFSKIDESDVFVADVTSVATYHPLDKDGNETDRLKATPNANVMIELGYATQVVGWDNIICIMNDDYNHDGEIPFDIRATNNCTPAMMILSMFPTSALTIPEIICGIACTMVVMICGKA